MNHAERKTFVSSHMGVVISIGHVGSKFGTPLARPQDMGFSDLISGPKMRICSSEILVIYR